MQVVGRRKDGVYLVSLGMGMYAAVNTKHRLVTDLDASNPVVSDFSVWPQLPVQERAIPIPEVRKVLEGQHRKVSLNDVGYGLEYDDEAKAVPSPSMDERRQMLQSSLDATIKRRFGSYGGGPGIYPSVTWIKEVRDQEQPPYVVYCDAEGKHFKWEYSDSWPPEFLGDPRPIEYVPVELRAAYLGKAEPVSLKTLADQEHPFTYCMEHIAPKADVDDPKAFCATMVHKATGKWPGEAKKKD
jgi:hypothetical protein